MAPLLLLRQTPVDPDINDPSATAAPPTDSNINSRADIYGSHNGLSNAQIGAIIGSVIGFTVLVLLAIFCVMNRRRAERRRRRRERRYYEGNWTESSGSSSSGGKASLREEGVRKPPVARVRRNVTVVDRDQQGWDGYARDGRMREQERERIPGGPKWPTYRAIPIPNPRRNPNLRRQM